METQGSDGACVSPPTDHPDPAGKSRRKSKSGSRGDQAKAVTSKAAGKPTDLGVELSLLQSVYEQAINAGLCARTTGQDSNNGQIPVLTIQIWNVSKCPECESWIVGRICPIC
ncbi:MAG: hypothetical protein ACREAB_01565 [Blastocatellia bacterium]